MEWIGTYIITHEVERNESSKPMTMEIEVISRETVKPSSPTPLHLRNYKLSLLDQFAPSILIPMVLFYPVGNDQLTSQKTQLLKQSLSKALTRFYPLAGKIKDNLSIDCNDEGAYYAEARVKAHMSDFLKQPHLPLIRQFLPCEAGWTPTIGVHVAMIQVNIFDCGGLAIGICISHMIADGIAVSSFLNSWASIACGFREAESPSYIAPSLFKQNESMPKELTLVALSSPFLKTGKCVTRRFVFNSSSISMLQAKATGSCDPRPTRVQAVSALIWKCFLATCAAKSDAQKKPPLLTHLVNMRRRASPPFSESSMGNFLCLAVAQCKAEGDRELHQLAGELKEAIRKVDSNMVQDIEGDEGFIKYCEFLEGTSKALDKEADFLGFTSWLHFSLYEIDFGWGTPAWATCVGPGDSVSVYLNTVVLMETKWGDGIEAWIMLDEQDMAIFERDRELMSYTLANQSPMSLSESVSRS